MAVKSPHPLPRRSPDWLLLVYQLPARPSNIRVRTWRRLQKVGAAGLKNSAYVLPNSAQAREDFEWIKAEITAMRGVANIFVADHIDPATQQEIVGEFRRARAADFEALRRAAEQWTRKAKRGAGTPLRQRLGRAARSLRDRWNEVAAIDFFEANGRDEARATVEQLEHFASGHSPTAKKNGKAGEKLMTEKYRSRTWVTRPRPGVDRMSSAWLIRRFIDPDARFAFAEKAEVQPNGVPFDMFGVLFSHEGDLCTFETLLKRFGIANPALERIGQIVHNLDLKEERFDVPEEAAVGRMVEGFRQMHSEDSQLLEHGMQMFEALYRSMVNTPPSQKASSKTRKRPPRSYLGLT